MQVDFDPNIVSYAELLKVFWEAHNPCEKSSSRQYRSLILTHNGEQAEQARASLVAEQEARGVEIKTEIDEFTSFTYAEDYHQKFSLRRHPILIKDMQSLYPEAKDIADSTVAMRLNAFCAGYGTLKDLKAEIEQFELSEAANAYLLNRIGPKLNSSIPGKLKQSFGGMVD